MNKIPQKLIQSYLPLTSQLFSSTSEHLFIATADAGNHYLDIGIREGTQLLFDQEKPYEQGKLSCFMDPFQKLHLLKIRPQGYTYLGQLIAAILAF